MRQKWVSEAARLRNVTVVSVGGGYRDYQVRSGLTSLPCPPGDPNKLSLVVRNLEICSVGTCVKPNSEGQPVLKQENSHYVKL